MLLVSPVDPNESCEVSWRFLHGKSSCRMVRRDMQSRAQRRQYGEPMARLSLSVRCGQRHTRWRERKLVSITCSSLLIRRQGMHVPHPLSPDRKVMESGTVHPYRSLLPTRPSLRSGPRARTPAVGQASDAPAFRVDTACVAVTITATDRANRARGSTCQTSASACISPAVRRPPPPLGTRKTVAATLA
jgi:hypothetical protein